jgi:REP element-mobilizing transposase RayT
MRMCLLCAETRTVSSTPPARPIVERVARPLRITIPDGLYHVIARGNNRDTVFRGERDFELFLDLLAHTVDRYRLLCHGYCLMTNHYNLILETRERTCRAEIGS